MHATRSAGLSVSTDGTGEVAHAGSIAVPMPADRCGLTKDLPRATARRSFVPVQDRNLVLVDVAVKFAQVGETVGDIKVPRHPGQVRDR